jgi:D-sedoheptulose 7-phosphate isomerase
MKKYDIGNHIRNSSEIISKLESMDRQLVEISEVLIGSLANEGAVFWFGNGGSASDAEHLAAELSGRFAHDRKPLNSHALTANSSVITAVSNDYGFEQVFSRQVQAHAKPGDVAIGISTSGHSSNVLNGLNKATQMGCSTVLLTGLKGTHITSYDYTIVVPSENTAHIQEAHITIGQAICGYIETHFLTLQ